MLDLYETNLKGSEEFVRGVNGIHLGVGGAIEGKTRVAVLMRNGTAL